VETKIPMFLFPRIEESLATRLSSGSVGMTVVDLRKKLTREETWLYFHIRRFSARRNVRITWLPV
jgi:hypothetical protein